MTRLEKGTVIAVDNKTLAICLDYTILINGVPAGTLKNNLTWFPETKKPAVCDIKEVVFLDDYAWGVKQFTSRVEEFNTLSLGDKEEILSRL